MDFGGGNLDTWLADFSAALSSGDPAAVADQFVAEGFWRDFVAFTWDICTLEGRAAIAAMVAATPDLMRTRNWRRDVRGPGGDTEGMITFETAHGVGRGYVRLRGDKCWTLLTTLESLDGHEERRGARRAKGFEPNPARPDENWQDALQREAAEYGREQQPYVLIIGGGQGGLGLAARLRMLNVPTLIVDRYPHVGDQWRSRYKSLSLHDPVWYDHMPYLPFPDTWPVFTPKDKIADWLEAYAKIMELIVWNSTEFQTAAYDEAAGRWTVEVSRGGEGVTLHPTHLVIATGNAGWPNLPSFPGSDDFQGQILHSSHYTGSVDLKGKRVAVIGSNNSAQDICADLASNGVDVTMIQRDSTHVIRSDTFIEVMMKGAYSEEALARGVTTEIADLVGASMPLKLLPDLYRPLSELVAQRDEAFYSRLEAAGFMHDFGEDGTGMPLKYLRTASGYYIDVGATELIANGSIKLRARVSIDHLEADGVVLSDGHKVIADMVICATGFSSMHQWVASKLSPEVADAVGKVWGYGSGTQGDPGPWEGELRNMWKPTGQPGLWFHGGNLSQARFYSQFLALQLKARLEALPVRPYRPG